MFPAILSLNLCVVLQCSVWHASGGVHGVAVVPDVVEDHAFLRVTLPSHTVASLNVLRPVPEERGENECDLFFGRANVDTPVRS